MEITAAYYIGFIILVAIIVYSVFVYYRNPNRNLLAPFDIPNGTMEESQNVFDSDKTRRLLLASAESSLMVYVFIQPSDKTPRADQVTNTLLEIPGVLQFNYGGTTTELIVTTLNTVTRETVEERIEIPAIPMQKWIQLSILRDGRRFDILYNDKMVASKRLEYMPVYTTAPVKIGGPQIRGSFRDGRVFNYRLSLQDVYTELSKTSNTRNKPPTSINESIGNPFAIFSCPGGFFCGADARTPKNALQEWQTPYA